MRYCDGKEGEGRPLADDVAVVHEEEDALAQARAVLRAEVLEELLVKLHVLVGVDAQHAVAARDLRARR